MNTKANNFTTARLTLQPLTETDAAFICELVNSSGWIEFIGDRNVRSIADSIAYIQKINNNKNITYWTVKIKENQIAIGVVTFIKRDYLEHHDLGFAFLPQFSKKGYAYEAAKAVLDFYLSQHLHTAILASTLPHNINSTRLLEKLGFGFTKVMLISNEKLLIYTIEKKD